MNNVPLDRLAATVGAEVGQVVRAIKISLFNGVIRDTRVGDPAAWKNPAPAGYVGGRLRGNWQTTVGAPAETEIDRIDASGAGPMADVSARVTADNVDFLTNNLPYAEVWEERDAMVARNVARIERNVREAAR